MQNKSDKLNRLLEETCAGNEASEKIRRAARENPAVAQALSRLTESDIAGISAILNDKQALKHIMSTPKAQALLKKFKG